MFLDNSKYNLCAGISNGINSCFHVQPSRIRNPAKSLWKYILCRRIHWRGRRGDKLQIGNVSWSQPFLHFSFPAKAKSSLILTRWLLGGWKMLENGQHSIRICQRLDYLDGEESWQGVWNICWRRHILAVSSLHLILKMKKENLWKISMEVKRFQNCWKSW